MSETNSPPTPTKGILVVGDLMIDRTWLVPNRSALATSQAHDDVTPRKLINPRWQTDLIGGAGFILRSVFAASERIPIFFAGAWSNGFDYRSFLAPEDVLPQSECPVFIPTATTPFDTEKFRVYEQTARGPRLIYRFDRDLSSGMYKDYSFSQWPKPEQVAVVVVTDFAKGFLDSTEIHDKLKEYADRPFLVDSKSKADGPIFQDLPWTLALPNREEFARLVDIDPVEAPSFRKSRGSCTLNPRLAEGLEIFAAKFNVDHPANNRGVLVKLDREGALLYQPKSPGNKLTLLALGNDEKKIAGIGAGDVVAANIAVQLTKQMASGQLDYLQASAYSVQAATAFCRGGTTIQHEPSGPSGGWYGISVKVNPKSVEEVKVESVSLAFSRPFTSVLVNKTDRAAMKKEHDSQTQAMLGATTPIPIKNAKWFLDDFLTVDHQLGTSILRMRSQFRNYYEAQDPKSRPFVAALCGSPGSGKSALADALPKTLDCEVIKENAAQWTSIEELFRLCERIRTVQVKRGKPFVFIDEVDAAVAGEKLYGKLLAPLGDGAYSSFGYVRELGPVIFLLAGSNPPWDSKPNLQSNFHEHEHPKLRDLVSRFSTPPIEVPSLTDRRLDALYLAAFLLYDRFPGLTAVQRGVLSLLARSDPKHGPRSIKEVVRAIGPLGDPSLVTISDVQKTAANAITMHLEVHHDWKQDTTRVQIIP